jgi:hypothetical protein
MITTILACVLLGLVGAAFELVRRRWCSKDDPAYPWNQPKRQGPILPGASPEMLRAIEQRNRQAKKK